MSKFIQLLSYLYRNLSHKDFSNQTIRNDIHANGDRRGKPILLKSYPTKNLVIEALDKVIGEQTESAQQKIAQSSHWGAVGHIEMYAIDQVKQVIKSHDKIDEPNDFVIACYGSFEELIKQWRNKTEDADGYGLATIKTIKRIL